MRWVGSGGPVVVGVGDVGQGVELGLGLGLGDVVAGDVSLQPGCASWLDPAAPVVPNHTALAVMPATTARATRARLI